ncbi:CPBP family intramembrane glutamic endopeptidase [Lacibacter sediminis]|uniref:CPBP family intramembrane metalloprotease n=1 Tax=Lacibacter sediminis TaxID=2760713 RepID=A0A7G5XBT9_9BACT|nr:CPBP family intramembrane glutamic endopeptidase [Lacibacter sediminis]QNA42942.1 CPBP family intramembrane metalloprotease [Lacibacter sediminis]
MATTKQLYTYIALLLIVSWTIQILAIISTGSVNSDPARIWLAGTMLTPLVVTIYFLNRNKNLKQKLFWKPNSKIFITSFFAVFIPIIIAFAVLITIQNLNYGQSEWFSFSGSGVTIMGGPFLFGRGNQSWFVFSSNIFITGAVFAMLNAFIATGEEFAWRGLLQPLLTDRFGLFKGITILGFIWSMWHLPMLLNGYNYPDNPIVGSFILFPIRLIATSYFYAWLTLKSNSFIPASIAHGALNGIQTAIVENIKLNTSQIYENVITILMTVIIGLLFLGLTYRSTRKDLTANTGT